MPPKNGRKRMAKVSPMMLLPPVIFAGLAVMFLWGMNRDDPTALPSTREGQQAPGLKLSELGDGQPFTEEDLRSDGVKLVNYWASWCAPCRAEHPQLETLASEGVVIFGVNYKDEAANALRFLADLGDPFTKLAADADGRTALDWGLYGVPETFIIDANGVVVKRFAGPITPSILENVIRPAMEEAAAN